MKYTYSDIWNINNKKDDNEASIIKVIRPGSDEYDEVHDIKHESIIPEYYEETCNHLINDDNAIDEFMKLYVNKVNENIISGKNVSKKAYNLYNLLRSL